jgi:hypothetical protein
VSLGAALFYILLGGALFAGIAFIASAAFSAWKER